MNKPKMLYASPLPPKKSGISDYSVILVRALTEYYDITLYTDNYDIIEECLADYPQLRFGVDTIAYDEYDYIVYNMGNNAIYHSYIYEESLKHPGIVILHDLVLYHFIREYYHVIKNTYYSSIYQKMGLKTYLEIKDIAKSGRLGDIYVASRHPMNQELLKSGNRFIVHSEYARNAILETGLVASEDVAHIDMICQIEEGFTPVDKHQLYSKYGVPEDAVVICSFGNIQPTKLNREICHAVKSIIGECDQKICYVMVGQGYYVDDELIPGIIIKTGYTEIEEFDSFLYHSDIVINLRTPSMGETSAAMLRIMQLGKPCITNNGGWFSEIPDDCVMKIELDNIEADILNCLHRLLNDNVLRDELKKQSSNYINKTCKSEVVTKSIVSFI